MGGNVNACTCAGPDLNKKKTKSKRRRIQRKSFKISKGYRSLNKALQGSITMPSPPIKRFGEFPVDFFQGFPTKVPKKHSVLSQYKYESFSRQSLKASKTSVFEEAQGIRK